MKAPRICAASRIVVARDAPIPPESSENLRLGQRWGMLEENRNIASAAVTWPCRTPRPCLRRSRHDLSPSKTVHKIRSPLERGTPLHRGRHWSKQGDPYEVSFRPCRGKAITLRRMVPAPAGTTGECGSPEDPQNHTFRERSSANDSTRTRG